MSAGYYPCSPGCGPLPYPYPYIPPNASCGFWYAILIVAFILLLVFGGYYWYYGGSCR
ncbi:hypothetical protein J9317_13480 [Metabacillus sp. KIGAM252]|uniref:YjcZ family sporulation protein n=1 Tax=Metabacillus flavus TaxID=2823519 RepID=A0ABS5LGB1_9BACI|nr:hypothetical protein [Metabacillus flavus]MBS2969778.1 hypothetical protein [Metabacillus flavus]